MPEILQKVPRAARPVPPRLGARTGAFFWGGRRRAEWVGFNAQKNQKMWEDEVTWVVKDTIVLGSLTCLILF